MACADAIVRLTADNPFVGAELVDIVIEEFIQRYPMVDYVSNTENSGYPFGLFVEVVNMTSLEELQLQKLSRAQLEHVTVPFRSCNSRYSTYQVRSNYDFGQLALSVDTMEDYIRLEPLFRTLSERNANFGLADIASSKKKFSMTVGPVFNGFWSKLNELLRKDGRSQCQSNWGIGNVQ